MEQITKLLKQLQTIWRQLGVNQRITIVGTGLLLVGALCGIVFWSGRADYALLYGKLDDTEAGKVVAALEEAKIPYQARGSAIMVPRDKVHSMRMQLAAKGVPRSDGVGFEIFDKSNFGISDFVQRANYMRALQGEISRTICQVETVENARVLIVLPENRLVVDDKKKATASVFVKVRGNVPLPVQTVAAIRFLVANAVEGLTPSNVSVVDNLGNVLSDVTDDSSNVGLTQTQLGVRKNLEQYLARKAEDMLNVALGVGQSVVRVSAELNFDSLTKTEEKYDPESQVLRTATINDENTDSTTASQNGGTPGPQQNLLSETNTVAAAPQNSNRVKKKVTTSQYEINKITSNLVQNGGTLARVSAAVFVAMRTEGEGTARKPLPRSKEELDKLKKIVQTALGIQENNGTRNDEINLEEIAFNDQSSQEITKKLETDGRRDFWLHLGQLSVLPVVAFGILVFFLRALKKSPELDIPIGIPLGELRTAANGNGYAHANGINGNGRHQPATMTVEMLNQLIRENPQNMTHAIRSWMARTKK
jgi:flagellar M-ring protein FliF